MSPATAVLRRTLKVVSAPAVWLFAALLLLSQRAGAALGSFLDAYDRAATALGHALLRVGRRLLDLLGPLGRLLRALTAPLWRAVRAVWRWLDFQVLMRTFRPLRGLGRWVVAHVRPPLERLVAWLGAAVEPVIVRLTRDLEAVDEVSARLDAAWRRLWAPVLATTARSRRRTPTIERPGGRRVLP